MELQFPCGPASVPLARGVIEGLAGSLPPDLLDDVRLLVSELVTNSVRHAGLEQHEAIALRLSVFPRKVRVEVIDSGPGFEPPAPRRPATDVLDGGWGLFLVDQLADRWGVDENGGTCVWFEKDSRELAGSHR